MRLECFFSIPGHERQKVIWILMRAIAAIFLHARLANTGQVNIFHHSLPLFYLRQTASNQSVTYACPGCDPPFIRITAGYSKKFPDRPVTCRLLNWQSQALAFLRTMNTGQFRSFTPGKNGLCHATAQVNGACIESPRGIVSAAGRPVG